MAWDVIKCLPMLLILINHSHGTAGRQVLYFYMDILSFVSVFRIKFYSYFLPLRSVHCYILVEYFL